MKRSIGTIQYIISCPLKTKPGCGTMSLRRCMVCEHNDNEGVTEESVSCNHKEDQ